MTHVFVSYSRQDKGYVEDLVGDLRQRGFDVWLDDRIDYGERWWQVIVQAIRECAAFVVVMSPDSEASEWVHREVRLAQREQKRVMPLLLRGKEFPLLIDLDYVDVTDEQLPPPDFYERLSGVLTPGQTEGKLVAQADTSATPVASATTPVAAQTQHGQDSGPAPPVTTLANRRALWFSGLAVVAALAIIGVLALQPFRLAEVVTVTDPPATLSNTAPLENEEVASTHAVTPSEVLPTTAAPQPTSSATNATPPAVTQTATTPAQSQADLAWTRVERNRDWTPVIETFDGVEMVLVPAGCFMMGSEDGQINEKPVHVVCFEEPFWIDRYEVTNEQYAAFLNDSSYQHEDIPMWLNAEDMDVRIHQHDEEWAVADEHKNHPAIELTWSGADDFCRSQGGRLPTEAEWEYAARGPDALVYPWGNPFRPPFVVYMGRAGGQTAAVDSTAGGASWVGAYHLSGNVREWVADWYGGYDAEERKNPPGPDSGDRRVYRGGSYVDGLETNLRAARRDGLSPDQALSCLGFRCARSIDQS